MKNEELKKRILNFILRFVALKAYWVFPLVYLLFSMLSFVVDRQGGSFSIYALILWTILGTLVYAVSNSWMSHELDMEELDFVGLDEVDDPDNMKRHLQDFFVGMSYWERLFWVLIVVCLVALVYMTAGGMNLLLEQTHGWSLAIAIVVALVLLFLLMMIARRRVVIGLVLAYIGLSIPCTYVFVQQYLYIQKISVDSDNLAGEFLAMKDAQLEQLRTVVTDRILRSSADREHFQSIKDSIDSYYGEVVELRDELNKVGGIGKVGFDEMGGFILRCQALQNSMVRLSNSYYVIFLNKEIYPRVMKNFNAADASSNAFFGWANDLKLRSERGLDYLMEVLKDQRLDVDEMTKHTVYVSMLVAGVVVFLPLVISVLIGRCRKRD